MLRGRMFKNWEYAVFWLSLMVSLVCLCAGIYASTGAVGPRMGIGVANFVNGFEWETITAGLFGLTAGLAVFSSSRTQIRYSIRHRVDSGLSIAYEVEHYLSGLKTIASNHLKNIDASGQSIVENIGGLSVWSIISGDGEQMREASKKAQVDIDSYDKGYVSTKIPLKTELPYGCWCSLNQVAAAYRKLALKPSNERSGDPDAYFHQHAHQALKVILDAIEDFSGALKKERARQIEKLSEM